MWRCAVDLNPTEGCPAFSLKSEIYMSLQVLVTGQTKWDIFPKERLFFSSILFSQGKIYRYQNYITRNESNDLTLCRTFVAYCNLLLQHEHALLYHIISCSVIIKAQVYYTHHIV